MFKVVVILENELNSDTHNNSENIVLNKITKTQKDTK